MHTNIMVCFENEEAPGVSVACGGDVEPEKSKVVDQDLEVNYFQNDFVTVQDIN